jgi:hypothetical protein
MAELPKDKNFGKFGFFVVIFLWEDPRAVLYQSANK